MVRSLAPYSATKVVEGIVLHPTFLQSLPTIPASISVHPNPIALRDEFSCNFSDVEVQDPYRWSEDDPKTEKVQQYIKELNAVCNQYILSPSIAIDGREHDSLLQGVLREKLMHYEQVFHEEKVIDSIGGAYRVVLDSCKGVYLTKGLECRGNCELFLDINELPAYQKIETVYWSYDGAICAYQLREYGSEWGIIKFRNRDGTDLPDLIEPVFLVKTHNCTWTPDNEGVLYLKTFSRSGKIDPRVQFKNFGDFYQLLYYHKIGSTGEDVLVQCNPEFTIRLMNLRKCPFRQGRFLLATDLSCGYRISTTAKAANKPFVDLEGNIQNARYTRIFGSKLTGNSRFKLIDINEKIVLAVTNHDAPNRKMISTSLSKANQCSKWETVIAESSTRYLIEVEPCADKPWFLLLYREEWSKVNLYVYNTRTKQLVARLNPPIEDVTWFLATQTGILLKTTSLGRPATYKFPYEDLEGMDRCLMDQDKSMRKQISGIPLPMPSLHHQLDRVDSPAGWDWREEFEIVQVLCPELLGPEAMIPMEIIQPKNCVLNGSNPTILYSYGGYGITLDPYITPDFAVFLKHFGGVIAFVHIRGGGHPVVTAPEGKNWHEQGKAHNQQTSFYDIAAAAQHLHRLKYTNPEKLVAMGSSKGAMLNAVCARLFPHLFRAFILGSGIYDMLRFNMVKGSISKEYGDPGVEADFYNLYNYSPLHNVDSMPVGWPAMLILAGEQDNRAPPFHSLKYVAAIHEHMRRSKDQNHNPVLARIFHNQGHYYELDEEATILLFLQKVLDLKYVE